MKVKALDSLFWRIASKIPLIGLIFWLYLDYKTFCHEYDTGIKRPSELKVSLQFKIFWHGLIVMIPLVVIVLLLSFKH